MRAWYCTLAFAAGSSLFACTLEPIVLAGRACPCPSGLFCDPNTQTCQPHPDSDGGVDGARPVFPPASPIGHWPLDEQQGVIAEDASGHGYALDIVGPNPKWQNDPTRGRVLLLPDGAQLWTSRLSNQGFPSNGTLSFWFRGDLVATQPTARPIFDSEDSTRDHLLVQVGGDDEIQVAASAAVPAGTGAAFVAAQRFPAARGVWHHLVLSWQTGGGDGLLTVWFDGALWSASVEARWRPADQQFGFGSGFPDLFLDEIWLYDRTLTVDELATVP